MNPCVFVLVASGYRATCENGDYSLLCLLGRVTICFCDGNIS